jgi:hypothetical protein
MATALNENNGDAEQDEGNFIRGNLDAAEQDEDGGIRGNLDVAEQNEDDFIRENLDYIDTFLKNLHKRDGALTVETAQRVNEFQTNWSQYFTNKSVVTPMHGLGVTSEGHRGERNITRRVVGVNSRWPVRFGVADSSDSSPEEDAQREECVRGSTSSQIANRRNDKHPTKHESISDPENWKAILGKIDNRKVPVLEKYTEDGGLPLDKYFVKFECHCEQNLRGDRNSWKGELEQHLLDKTLKAFRSLHDMNDSYDAIKNKLCDWYRDHSEVRRERNKALFKSARPDPKESMFLFSSRLERLFRIAYPRKHVNVSRKLCEKFIASSPKRFAKIMKSQIMTCKINGAPMKWTMLQKCARHYDVEREREGAASHDSADEDFTINVLQKKRKDAVVQVEAPGVVSGKDIQSSYARGAPNVSIRSAPEHYTVDRSVSSVPQNTKNPWRGQVNHPTSYRNDACTFCNRVGHERNRCRSRLGLCFGCGGANHVLRDCPNKRQATSPRQIVRLSHQSSRPPTRNEEVNRRSYPLNLQAPTRER